MQNALLGANLDADEALVIVQAVLSELRGLQCAYLNLIVLFIFVAFAEEAHVDNLTILCADYDSVDLFFKVAAITDRFLAELWRLSAVIEGHFERLDSLCANTPADLTDADASEVRLHLVIEVTSWWPRLDAVTLLAASEVCISQ